MRKLIAAAAVTLAALSGCSSAPVEQVDAGVEEEDVIVEEAVTETSAPTTSSTTTTTLAPTPTISIPGDDGRVRACVEKVAEVLAEHGYTILVELEMAVMAAIYDDLDPTVAEADFTAPRDLFEAQCAANLATAKLAVLEAEVPVQ